MSTRLATGFYPFWFWNDALTADEIRWQVQQMAAQGVKGFFVRPRLGLQQPYLRDSGSTTSRTGIEISPQKSAWLLAWRSVTETTASGPKDDDSPTRLPVSFSGEAGTRGTLRGAYRREAGRAAAR